MISTLQISVMLDYGKDCFRKNCRGIKLNKRCQLYLGSGGHGDCLARVFGGHKGFYNSQWPLTGHYFKCYYVPRIEELVIFTFFDMNKSWLIDWLIDRLIVLKAATLAVWKSQPLEITITISAKQNFNLCLWKLQP